MTDKQKPIEISLDDHKRILKFLEEHYLAISK